MANFDNIFNDYMSAYQKSSKYKDDILLDIGLRKQKYEETLDEMWANYLKGCPQQIVTYNEQVKYIKDTGCRIQRSKSTGKHTIIIQ
jgi:hypothetical protein